MQGYFVTGSGRDMLDINSGPHKEQCSFQRPLDKLKEQLYASSTAQLSIPPPSPPTNIDWRLAAASATQCLDHDEPAICEITIVLTSSKMPP